MKRGVVHSLRLPRQRGCSQTARRHARRAKRPHHCIDCGSVAGCALDFASAAPLVACLGPALGGSTGREAEAEARVAVAAAAVQESGTEESDDSDEEES